MECYVFSVKDAGICLSNVTNCQLLERLTQKQYIGDKFVEFISKRLRSRIINLEYNKTLIIKLIKQIIAYYAQLFKDYFVVFGI